MQKSTLIMLRDLLITLLFMALMLLSERVMDSPGFTRGAIFGSLAVVALVIIMRLVQSRR